MQAVIVKTGFGVRRKTQELKCTDGHRKQKSVNLLQYLNNLIFLLHDPDITDILNVYKIYLLVKKSFSCSL